MFALRIKPEKPEAHIQLLGTLFLICQKCRREGLMAIEMDIERPRESDVFTAVAAFDEANAVIYTVLCDTLRLIMVGNPQTSELTRYLAAARKTSNLAKKQQSMFDVLESCMLSHQEGYAPAIAVEYGRQCVPAGLKPDFNALEDYLRTLPRENNRVLSSVEMDASLVQFFDSLNKPGLKG